MTPALKSLLMLIATCGMVQGAGADAADPGPPPGRPVGWREIEVPDGRSGWVSAPLSVVPLVALE